MNVARRSFSTKDRTRIFAAHDGVCHLCKQKIDGVREAWEVEHVIAYALTRDNSDENLRPAHKRCHAEKTAADVAAIAKAKRREAKHAGAARPKQSIRSAGFQKAPAKEPKQIPANQSYLYRLWSAGRSTGEGT
jgi:5-methylcytosine-specific restriction protein A